MIVFKVVYKWDDDLFQSFAIDDSAYCLSYEIGKVTKTVAGSLGIFCFETVDDAAAFRDINCCEIKDQKIIELEAIGGMRNLPRQIPSPFFVYEFYDESTENWEIEFIEPPAGTVLAEAVRTIRVLD